MRGDEEGPRQQAPVAVPRAKLSVIVPDQARVPWVLVLLAALVSTALLAVEGASGGHHGEASDGDREEVLDGDREEGRGG